MDAAQKRIVLNLVLALGLLLGVVLTLLGFIPSRDLNNYNRLTSGDGQTVQAVSEGGVAATFSGSRGKRAAKYCTSWRYELDGNERHFTDRKDCSVNQNDADSNTTAQLVYDPSDLGIMFVQSDETLSKLKSTQSTMRVLATVGAVLLVASIAGFVMTKRSKK